MKFHVIFVYHLECNHLKWNTMTEFCMFFFFWLLFIWEWIIFLSLLNYLFLGQRKRSCWAHSDNQVFSCNSNRRRRKAALWKDGRFSRGGVEWPQCTVRGKENTSWHFCSFSSQCRRGMIKFDGNECSCISVTASCLKHEMSKWHCK